MPKKKEAPEIEVELSKNPPKKKTLVKKWFDETAVTNTEDLLIVCELVARSAYEQFRMTISSGNIEVFGIIFYATFESILEFIRSKQKTYNRFTMEIMNSINIGYTNNSDEENEKVGNFMPIMEHIGVNKNIVNDNTTITESSTTQAFMRWTEQNIKKTVDYYKEIQENARQRLQTEYRTSVRTSEAMLPIFCIFMDTIVNVLKQKFYEAKGTDVSEVSMNVFGLFDAFYSYDEEEDREIVEFRPNVDMKLSLKADDAASVNL